MVPKSILGKHDTSYGRTTGKLWIGRMNETLTVMTDCASIAIFDPDVTRQYEGDDLDSFNFDNIDGVKHGLFTGFRLGGDGVYQIRFCDDDLLADERDYAVSVIDDLRVLVKSGTVCVGGYGLQNTADGYPSFSVMPGMYRLTIYEILWDVSPKWFRDDSVPPADAPADFVVLFGRLTGDAAYYRPHQALRLDTVYLPFHDDEPFLFASSTRRIGIEVGMTLQSSVIKSPTSAHGLRLKECGIELYKADLVHFHGLKRRDRIRFRVTAIDHEKMMFCGELVEKL